MHINDGFAKLTESLYIAERQAREAIETRAAIRSMAANKERMTQEAKLREIAQRAREERAGMRPAHGGDDEEDESAIHERDELRHERARERERERRMHAAAPEKRNKLLRENQRDISERIALGLPALSSEEAGAPFLDPGPFIPAPLLWVICCGCLQIPVLAGSTRASTTSPRDSTRASKMCVTEAATEASCTSRH